MSKNTFRKIAAVTLVVCMLFAVCGVAFAQSRMITASLSSFIRNSNTRGTASLAACTTNNEDPYIVSKMTLQEAPLGSTSFVNSNEDPQIMTSTRSSISHVATFPITTRKEYRVKMEITETINGSTYKSTIYEELQ